MRASRLLSLLMALQLRRRVTAHALAAEFEVSVRTIYRDIDELSAAGVPVFADRGPGGGFQLLDGYRTRLTGMAAGEAEALFISALPGAAAAMGIGPEAAMAARKLLTALPGSLSEAAQKAWSRFHLDPVGWYRAASPVEHLPAIARAVWDQTGIDIGYESWKGVRNWRLDPLGLILKAGDWYMAGRGGGRIRIFKVANVMSLAPAAGRFDYPDDFDLPAFWAAELTRFEAGLRGTTARVRASAVGAKRVSELGAYAAEAVAAGQGEDDGGCVFDLPVESLERTALTLLGLGREIEVLAPQGLRDAIRDEALKVTALYAGTA